MFDIEKSNIKQNIATFVSVRQRTALDISTSNKTTTSSKPSEMCTKIFIV
ncbi:hypothetical protein PALB_9040 [Pseudoalteromonas luteoviolacea B = ATCC 29581]|nr:hypothetical protein PALB_9040 [Pseudoalteromonas luteoviolacea B = ATCC 29581]